MTTAARDEKSFAASFGSLAFLASTLWLGVYLGVWNGLYADIEIVRTMVLSFVIAPPIARFFSVRFGRPLTRTWLFYFFGTMSLVACLLSAVARERMIADANRGLLWWVVLSIVTTHVLSIVVATRPLISERLWSRTHVRVASRTLAVLAFAQALVFAVIAFYVSGFLSNRDFKDGFFTPPAPHLVNYEPPSPPKWQPWDGKTLKVLSYNAWDIEGWIPQFIASPSRDLELRLRALPRAIASLRPDIVVFQEVWKYQTRLRIAHELRAFGYDFTAQGSDSFMSWFGVSNGLLIVSRLPLEGFRSVTFDVETRFDEGPIFARKGVISTRVNVGGPGTNPRWIDLYATHLGGFSTETKDGIGHAFLADEQAAKLTQTLHLSKYIKETSKSEAMILAADLNTHPYRFEEGRYLEGKYTPEYAHLTCGDPADVVCLGLKDSVEPTREMFTYDTQKNYYASMGRFSYEPRGRIDYVFSKGTALEPKEAKLVLDEVVLSDHYGLLVTYEIK